MRRAALLLLFATACGAPAWKQTPHDVRFQRTPPPILHEMPKTNETLDGWYAINHSTIRPMAETLNPGHYIDKARGGTPALDVNAFGEVIDSVWFENRISKRTLGIDELRRGPNEMKGPDGRGFQVLGGKIEGATPGLILQDENGVRYVAKFDPPAYPGLASGAELIATKILWAAGYHVPENYVATLDVTGLKLADGAATGGNYGSMVALTPDRMKALLSHVNPFPDGTARTLFSRVLPGRVVGPFDYRGQRADDPNDNTPHERRRSLRGLWMFAAWLNNVDARASNTLDVFLADDDGQGFVKHYLLDFGDALGSAGQGPKYPGESYEAAVDWPKILRSLFSFGIWYRDWLAVQRSPFRSVGIFEADIFEPDDWRSSLPNPAFAESTPLDDYWAASIIARFSPDHLAAVVDEAGYTETGARDWILRVLLARQFKVLEYGFARVLALDDPRLDGGTLKLTDLEFSSGLVTSVEPRYRWSLRWDGDDEPLVTAETERPRAPLVQAIAQARKRFGDDLKDDPFVTVTFERLVPEHGATVDIHLRVLDDGVLVVGVDRTVD